MGDFCTKSDSLFPNCLVISMFNKDNNESRGRALVGGFSQECRTDALYHYLQQVKDLLGNMTSSPRWLYCYFTEIKRLESFNETEFKYTILPNYTMCDPQRGDLPVRIYADRSVLSDDIANHIGQPHGFFFPRCPSVEDCQKPVSEAGFDWKMIFSLFLVTSVAVVLLRYAFNAKNAKNEKHSLS